MYFQDKIRISDLVAYCYYNASDAAVGVADSIVRAITCKMHMQPFNWLDDDVVDVKLKQSNDLVDRSLYYKCAMDVLNGVYATPEDFFGAVAGHRKLAGNFYKDFVGN